jgi:hypothetical protein
VELGTQVEYVQSQKRFSDSWRVLKSAKIILIASFFSC